MKFILVVLLVSFLALFNDECNALRCICDKTKCEENKPQCDEYVSDICSCCVNRCAHKVDEPCGGPWTEKGICGKGLFCDKGLPPPGVLPEDHSITGVGICKVALT